MRSQALKVDPLQKQRVTFSVQVSRQFWRDVAVKLALPSLGVKAARGGCFMLTLV